MIPKEQLWFQKQLKNTAHFKDSLSGRLYVMLRAHTRTFSYLVTVHIFLQNVEKHAETFKAIKKSFVLR